MKRAALFIAMLLTIAMPTYMQEEPQNFTGTMGDDLPDDYYPVTLEAGETITVSGTATSGDLDVYLVLEDPDGNFVIENDDRDSTTLDSYFVYTVTRAGEYNVIVSNIPETSGDYALTITVNAAASTQEEKEVHTGYMGDDVPDDYYPVTLEAGQLITVTAAANSDNLDTFIGLEDAEGNVLVENDDRNRNTLNSYFAYAVRESGEYSVFVSNIRDTAGNYTLTITIGSPPPSTGAENPPILDADAQVYTGFMSDDVTEDRYVVTLNEGEALRAIAEATDGDLDTYLLLLDSNETVLAENDDREFGDFNSELVFIPQTAGDYTVVMTNFPETSGEYELTVSAIPAEEAQIIARVRLSGTLQTHDTEHFRIHYTLEGEDATTESFAQQVGDTMEEVRRIQVEQLGWPAPVEDGILGGDNRYDIYLANVLGSGDTGLGYTSPELPSRDNPNTDLIEDGATPSYIVLDNDYDPVELDDPDADPIRIMRATAAHEYHHAIQFGYDSLDSHNWYYEATAAWMETITLPREQEATGYVATTFNYPEICFGADGDADPTAGSLMYGEWLFIQSLVDAHGDKAVLRLWENIALYDGREAINRTLDSFGDTLVDAVRRYRFQNLVRDYRFTPDFEGATVWQETVISEEGEWTPTGDGIQGLAANYYGLSLGEGVYNVTVDDPSLELWLVGITGREALITPLGTNGSFDHSGYDYAYLMVFNPSVDEDVTICDYQTYALNITRTDAAPAEPTLTLNALQFLELE